MRHLSSFCHPFLFLNSNHHTSPPSPYPNLFILWRRGCKFRFSTYNRVCGHLSFSFRFVCATGEAKERGGRDEDSQHGVSVSVDLLLPVYWIDADQSTATSRPCRYRWPKEETPLQFPGHGSFIFEPFDIWCSRTRLVSRFTTEVGWFTSPLSIFSSDSFSLFLPLSSIRDNRKGLSAACNKFEVSRTYMLEISTVLRKFLCFRRRKTCLEFDTTAEYFMSFERCL